MSYVTRQIALSAWATRLVAVLALCGLSAGCGREQLADGLPNNLECNSCHGGDENDAPPEPVGDAGTTDDIAIGAHQSHLTDGENRAAIECEECHLVPETIAAKGHIDALPAELTFGELASAEDAEPAWDRETARCSGTYCHGSTLSDGEHTEPQWTLVDESQIGCDGCHGEPPGAPHPVRDECELCHSDTVLEDGTIDIAGGAHMNGEIDFGTDECNLCHGSEDNDAPPLDTLGNDAETEVTVGAHQSHLAVSDWHREVVCEDCHVVPEEWDDDDHLDDPPAEVTWSDLAGADDATPSFDRDAAVCAGVYCHGTTLQPGGTLTEPTWTNVDGTQVECGTCHGEPPGGGHPTTNQCFRCHEDVIDEELNFIAPELHINGTVEVAEMQCNSCHGNDDNDAPPIDTLGNSDDTLVTVGAHQSHLVASDWHREVLCGECHVVPAEVDDVGHLDDPPAEVTWNGVALADGATPGPFDALSATCTGVYCHGSTLMTGGSNIDPIWTSVGTG
ncbi:MAG: CxxxxCH/CxxCH domain-containing protein, partial [Deltaproteobacteria bacterium]|nr:CxxxxCH/CxxCH domain-containing protein [Deltaproteobacteria bacterium]